MRKIFMTKGRTPQRSLSGSQLPWKGMLLGFSSLVVVRVNGSLDGIRRRLLKVDD